jgi:predicted nuclease of predicted toxin-antitoxin system
MTLRFIVDAQLPPALCKLIADFGHTAQHVFDLGLNGTQDRLIWNHAKATACVVVTKDNDFVSFSILDANPPPLVLIRIGNMRRVNLLVRMQDAMPRIAAEIERGERIIEVL